MQIRPNTSVAELLPNSLALRAGALVTVRTVGQGPPGTALLEVNGVRMLANIATAGLLPEAFQARVSSVGANLVLQILNGSPSSTLQTMLLQMLPRQHELPGNTRSIANAGGAELLSNSKVLSTNALSTALLAVRVIGEGPPGSVVLEVNGVRVQAKLPTEGTVPENFQARVVTSGEDTVLEIINNSQNEKLQSALFQLLPRQQGLPTFLHDLSALVQRSSVTALPRALNAQLEALLATLPNRNGIASAKGLQDAVDNCGLFLEARLAEVALLQEEQSARSMFSRDWKAALLRFDKALADYPSAPRLPANPEAQTTPLLHYRPLIPQPRIKEQAPNADDVPSIVDRLRSSTSGVLARLESSQLQTSLEGVGFSWVIELPVCHEDQGDVLQLRVRRDGDESRDAAATSWRMEFSLDIPHLGPLRGEVRLLQTQVSVSLWADSSATVTELESALPALAKRLGEEGLFAGILACRLGRPVDENARNVSLVSATA